MKKYFILLMLLLFGMELLAQSKVLTQLASYSTQEVFGGLKYSRGDAHAAWPYILNFYGNGAVLCDLNRNRIIYINELYEIESEIELKDIPTAVDEYLNYYENGIHIFELTNGKVFFQNSTYVWDSEGNRLSVIDDFQNSQTLEQINESFRIYDRVFFKMRSGEFWSFGFHDLNKNRISLLKDSPTRSLFSQGSTWPHPGLELDSRNRLIVNGDILTRNWQIFLEWIIEKYGRISVGPQAYGETLFRVSGGHTVIANNSLKYQDLRQSQFFYNGTDAAGNTLWDHRYVFSPTGTLLMVLPRTGRTILSSSLGPNGDYYTLEDGGSFLILSKLENTWSPEAKMVYLEGLDLGKYRIPLAPTTAYRAPNGTVLEDGVRVRWYPNTQEGTGVNTRLRAGDIVQILARTQGKETIGGQESYWYAVKTSDGVYGWSFGAFIQVQEPDKVLVGNGYFGP